MLSEVLDRIEQRLKAKRISATAASKLAGLSEDAIRNMRRAVEKDARQGISTSTIMALAPVLDTTASWLLEGVGPEADQYIPIIGFVGADNEGAVVYTTGQESGDLVPIPPGGDTTSRALEVRGHSGGEWAPPGSIVYFDDQRRPPTPDMLGYPCVVETEDGRVLLKRLLKGSRPDVFDLESRVGPTLEDVRLHWAAEVTYVAQPKQARKIIRRPGERQVA